MQSKRFFLCIRDSWCENIIDRLNTCLRHAVHEVPVTVAVYITYGRHNITAGLFGKEVEEVLIDGFEGVGRLVIGIRRAPSGISSETFSALESFPEDPSTGGV